MSRVRLVLGVLVGASLAIGAAAGSQPRQLAWAMVAHRTPRIMWANMKHYIPVRVRNAGSLPWASESGDNLAYHWLRPDGSMVVRDGLRTRYPAPVEPGEVVDVVALVQAPSEAGRYVLEWEPVRELVRWYGPPEGGERLRIPVLVTWRCAWVGAGFALLTVAALAGGRWAARRRPALGWWWRAMLPPVWAWGAVGLITVAFSELVGRQLWTGTGWLVASGAAALALPVVVVPVRARPAVAAAVALLVTIVTLGDLVYLRWFGNIVPVTALAGLRQLGQVEGSVRALFAPTDAWLLPAGLAGLLLALLPPRWRRETRPPSRERWLAAAVVLGTLLLASLPAGRALRRALADPATAEQVFSQQMLVGQWGIVNLHLLDAARTLQSVRAPKAPPPQLLEAVRALFARQAAAAPASGPGFAAATGCNLVLVQVESLQQWVIGARVLGQEVTPFLNSLAKRGLYFSGVYDQSAEGRSSDGEFAALNSLLPLPRGAVAFLRTRNRFFALPAVLKAQGYTTLSAHAFERGFWNRAILHPRYGFDRSLFQRELGGGEVIGWGLADGPFLQRMVPHITHLPQPFFAFLITLGLHHPFDQFPARHKVLDVGELAGSPLGNYIHAMHYVDGELRRFVTALDEAGVLAHTVVAIYGDHESGLPLDENLLRLLGAGEWRPSLPLRLRRVPLLVRLPGRELAGEVGEAGGHVDIAPTLLHLLGVPRPPSFLGTAILPGRDAIAVIPGGSAVGRGLLLASRGAGIPDGGACFAADGNSRPLSECRALAEEARTVIQASAAVLDHDLVPLLAGGNPGRAAVEGH